MRVSLRAETVQKKRTTVEAAGSEQSANRMSPASVEWH